VCHRHIALDIYYSGLANTRLHGILKNMKTPKYNSCTPRNQKHPKGVHAFKAHYFICVVLRSFFRFIILFVIAVVIEL